MNENLDNLSEEFDFTRPSFEFRPKEQHDWRQQALYLVCKSCDLQHAVYIGSNKMLVGLDEEGRPLLVNSETYRKLGFKEALAEAKRRLHGDK